MNCQYSDRVVWTILYIQPDDADRVGRNQNRKNRKKHGIDFETAQMAFDDPHHISEVTQIVDGEERWSSIGYVEDIMLITVGYTYRLEPPDEIHRLITARRATRRERKQYEEAQR